MDTMFCFQCQETAGGKGCTRRGVCGKEPRIAALQDILIWLSKGVGAHAAALRSEGKTVDREIFELLAANLFTTITNANFDEHAIAERIRLTLRTREGMPLTQAGLPAASRWSADCNTPSVEAMLEQAASIGVLSTENEDIRSLRELVTYGLKGLCAYAHHAAVLGGFSEKLEEFLPRALASTLPDGPLGGLDSDALIALTLETGHMGVEAMALLDKSNTLCFGKPQISSVFLGAGDRPGILVSGHDLRDLEMLLQQTSGSGVDVYTHSEMLPAHAYPAFKKYSHLRGNYGNAWWKQNEEFEAFNGPILMTTNCVIPPRESYKGRLYTTGAAGWPGCPHIEADENGHKDFSAIIRQARSCPAPAALEEGNLTIGFAHDQVLALADKVIEAVKSGAIKKFVVMAGCDGRMKSRRYYAEFARALPRDTVILTAGCAKYKYNKLGLGDINGIPRVLDAGQCNDSYSLALTALALKDAFGLDDVNKLPIVYNIAWYEQKAVIVLLALLALGVKNIHLGPTLPAFLSPAVAKVLVENFGIAGIGTVEDDIRAFFG